MSEGVRIELVVGPRPADADLRLADCESPDDFEDELRETVTARKVVIDLHAAPGMALTVPEAIRMLVRLKEAANVRCVVSSDAARKAAERLIPAYVRPDREAQFSELRVVVKQGDIVRVPADAIVNASNVRLELGAGVSEAIRRAVANPDALQAEMLAKSPIEPGEVVATGSHGLSTARQILHAATASGGEGSVARGYEGVLELAGRMELTSIAEPALGTGTGGVNAERSATLLLVALESRASVNSVRVLTCVLFDGDAADSFASVLAPP